MDDVEFKPTIVTIPSSSGTGAGGLVVPEGRPVIIHIVTPMMIVLVRATRVFLQTLLGLVTAGTVVPNVLPAGDFMHLVGLSASLALAPAGISVVQSLIELLTKLDQAYPTLTV